MFNNFYRQGPFIIFISGASGSGKTTLVTDLYHELNDANILCLHFDDVGVPSEQKMVEEYGSTNAWQKAMTEHWITKIHYDYLNKQLVIIEGQVNLEYITTTFNKFNLSHYKIILVDCDDATRHQRLMQYRNQPELANIIMDDWAEYLRNQAIAMQVTILDTSALDRAAMLARFKKLLSSLGITLENRSTMNMTTITNKFI